MLAVDQSAVQADDLPPDGCEVERLESEVGVTSLRSTLSADWNQLCHGSARNLSRCDGPTRKRAEHCYRHPAARSLLLATWFLCGSCAHGRKAGEKAVVIYPIVLFGFLWWARQGLNL